MYNSDILPTPTISWFKDGEILAQRSETPHILFKQQSIEIINLMVRDEGSYRCVVENDVGKIERKFKVNIEIAPTIISDTDTEIELLTGEFVELSCVSSGFPKPTVMWFKEGEELESTDSTLTIEDVNVGFIIIQSSIFSQFYKFYS